MITFPQNLQYLREQKGISQQEISKATGITEKRIPEMENGSIEPSLEELVTIASYFQIDIGKLLTLDLEAEQKLRASFDFQLLALDIDGVLTDGGMYYTEGGDEFKKFNTKDGMAIKKLVKAGKKVAFISSGLNKTLIENRAKLLGVELVYVGTQDKIDVLVQWCQRYSLQFSQIAYVGDDVNDYDIMQKAGLTACPSDATDRIKKIAHVVLQTKGGDGCVREFIDRYIMHIE